MSDSSKVSPLGATPVLSSMRYTFHSQEVGAGFVIDICLPPAYLPGDGPWPVVLVTDGNMGFAAAASTAAILPLEPGGPQPVCIVGIGYELSGEGEKAEHLVLRNRDLTPVRAEEWEMRMRAAPPPFYFGEELQTGGGERFLDFLENELKPWLAENLPVDIDDCTLAGTSLGGALALHAMFTRPGAFARILAISPSLWWANDYLVQLEDDFAAGNDDLAAKLYLCVGEAEEAQDPNARMVSNFIAFSDRMVARGYPSLAMTAEVLPGETHVSVFNAAISNGLRRLFGAKINSDVQQLP
jgi:predicted alpha/beta superfamily hydrolase